MTEKASFISSEPHFLFKYPNASQKSFNRCLNLGAKLVPCPDEWAAGLFTGCSQLIFPVYHPHLYKSSDFWNANEVCGCLFALLFWWLNSCIRFRPLSKWKTNQNCVVLAVNSLRECRMSVAAVPICYTLNQMFDPSSCEHGAVSS